MLSRTNTQAIDAVAQKLESYPPTLQSAGLHQITIFNTVYLIITKNVRQRIEEFEHPQFLNHFDQTFARYYLAAVKQFSQRQLPSLPWLIAFRDAHQHKRQRPIAKLALGVNAHITNDIALALRDTHAQPKHYSDYQHVNRIIFDSTDEIIEALPYRWCQYRLTRWPIKLTMAAITVYWRRLAWREFEQLNLHFIDSKQLQQKAGRRALRLSRIPF